MSRRIESIVAAGLLLAAMLLAALLTDHGILFSRPLWLDEYHTVLVASRSTPALVVSDLRHGADLAPPLLHLGVWTFRQLFGPLTATKLHALSFAAVWLALVLVYLSLRRVFATSVSAAGALAVASHALVISHTFEARYYGFWLLFCAAFAWAAGVDHGRTSSKRRALAVAIASVLLCTIHWFGVLTLALMCVGVAVAGEGGWSGRVRRLGPAAAGIVVLSACSPLVFAQRKLFTTPIWVPDLNVGQVVEMSRTFFVSAVPVLATLILVAGTFREPGSVPTDDASRARWWRHPSMAALISLSLMPVVIALVSWLVQPTMLPRYAIATSLAWAPLAAAAAQSLRRPQRLLWSALLLAIAWMNVRAEAAAKRAFAVDVAADVRAYDEARPTGIPILFQLRHVLYPVAAIHPERRDSMALLVIGDSLLDAMFPRGTPVGSMGRFFRFERDAARLHVATYGFPRLTTVAQADSLPRFFLLARDASLPRGYKDVQLFGRAVFPGYRVVRLRENLALFAR